VTVSACAYQAVQLIVWSGTGNTRHVAERMAAIRSSPSAFRAPSMVKTRQ
jgi:hypothetical protein